MLRKVGLYFRTLRHMKLRQITSRSFKLARPAGVPTYPQGLVVCSPTGPITPWVTRPCSLFTEDEAGFLNVRKKIVTGADWNNPQTPKLWLYNLHYFDGLLDDTTEHDLKTEWINRWIEDNPPAAGNGWEPYTLSLRIGNWIKWALAGGTLDTHATESLKSQTSALMERLEYHLLGNHLLANGKALVMAGCYFDGPIASKWLSTGLAILDEQIPEQFLPDGGHFELSTTYHALLTEDLLDLVNMSVAYDIPALSKWRNEAERALEWLGHMTRPDGLPPLFNDAANGISPSCQELFHYASALGLAVPPAPIEGFTDLPDSGYMVWKSPDYQLWFDAGVIGPEYQPGHGHCDMLSFELFAGGQPVFIDQGVSTYDIGSRRYAERSTGGHNTVQAGASEQSEIWSAFRVGRRAKITKRIYNNCTLVAEHDGFRAKGVLHERRINFAADLITITDCNNGRKNDAVLTARLHCSPDIIPVFSGDHIQAGPISLDLEGHSDIRIVKCDHAAGFNRRIPGHVIEMDFTGSMCATIRL